MGKRPNYGENIRWRTEQQRANPESVASEVGEQRLRQRWIEILESSSACDSVVCEGE